MIRPTQLETRNPEPATRFRGSGFTIMELLVVVAIMILLFTIAVPGIRTLLNSGKTEKAIALVGTATASIRVYANQSPAFPTGSYQGVALIFTPSNEIRYTQHTYYAKDDNGDFLVNNSEAGYADVDREYVQLPTGTGALGISMGGTPTSPELYLVTPPFAIRFNPNGHLIARRSNSNYGMVYYDGDYNGIYKDTTISRPNSYDPAPYDPDSPSYDANTFNVVEQKHEMRFDEIETVIGVLVFDKIAFAEQGFDLDETNSRIDANAYDWLMENGEPVFFNRYNGSRIRP